MNTNESLIVNIHIKYGELFTLMDLKESIDLLNEGFEEFYGIYLDEDSKNISPQIYNIKKGSLIVDIIVPIACALLPKLYDTIERKFSQRRNYKIVLKKKKMQWSYEDNYKVCKVIIQKYVIEKCDLSLNDVIKNMKLSKNYGEISIEDKIKNTKYLLEQNNIKNTLKCGKLSNCSKQHKKAFGDACLNFGV